MPGGTLLASPRQACGNGLISASQGSPKVAPGCASRVGGHPPVSLHPAPVGGRFPQLVAPLPDPRPTTPGCSAPHTCKCPPHRPFQRQCGGIVTACCTKRRRPLPPRPPGSVRGGRTPCPTGRGAPFICRATYCTLIRRSLTEITRHGDDMHGGNGSAAKQWHEGRCLRWGIDAERCQTLADCGRPRFRGQGRVQVGW